MQVRSPRGTSAPSDRGSVLADRKTLPGQGGFLDLQRRRDGDPAIGRHQVPRLHQHYIPRHQIDRVDLEHLAIPADAGDGLHHRSQGGDALLGLRLLPETDHRVEDGETGEKHRGRGITGHQLVDQRRRQQHDLHEVLVLADERPGTQTPSPPRRADSSRTSPHALRPREPFRPTLWVHLEGEGRLGRFHGVPIGALSHLGGHGLLRVV